MGNAVSTGIQAETYSSDTAAIATYKATTMIRNRVARACDHSVLASAADIRMKTMAVASVWRRIVRRWDNAKLIDAARVATDKGRCAEFLPCLDDEPCTAVDPDTGEPAAIVRAPDGTHFCPDGQPAVNGVTQACPVWASGAWRFARAIAKPIVGDVLGSPGSPPPTLPGPADLLP